ncbi:MAG TPA: ABC transporter permease [Candidatus Limnocylindria bacterium]
MRFGVYWALFIASVKMFIRNRAALFFSLVVPLLIMLIFGVLNFGGTTQVSLGLVDQANNQASATLRSALNRTDAFEIQTGEQPGELDELKEGHRDLVLVIPAGFELQPASDPSRQLTAYTNLSKPQQAQIGGLLLNAVVSQVMLAAGQPGGPVGPVVKVTELPGRNLGYIDFLVPGMLALTVMQLGIFSVAFGFVQLKRTGALRRLFATPTSPAYFLGAQVTSRLLIGLAQVLILLGVGLWFGLQLVGSVALLLAVSVLGSCIFLAMGFSVAGWAKNEDQAAPVANLLSLPMTFLSGVFFPRDAMPDLLQRITEFLPLTYLSDALRKIANDGAGPGDIGGDLLGLAVWAVVAFVVAIRLFSWE